MTAINQMELANDTGFQRRVKFFMSKSAVAIMGETAGLRTTYASAVLSGLASIFEMAVSVASDSAVEIAGNSVADTEIDSAITARWDAMSGVTGP